MANLEALNRKLFLMLNANANTPPWQIFVAKLLARYVIYLIPLLLVAIWLWSDHAQRIVALHAFVVAMAGLGANQMIGRAWPHPRPFVTGLGHTFMEHAPDSSFPSDHATIITAVGLTFLVSGMSLLGLAILLAGVVVSWSRIFLGIHFPLDMIGAVIVACSIALIIAPLWAWFGEAFTQLGEALYGQIFQLPIHWGWIRV